MNRGNRLTKSTFRNIGIGAGGVGGVAVYLDDQMSGWELSDRPGPPGAFQRP